MTEQETTAAAAAAPSSPGPSGAAPASWLLAALVLLVLGALSLIPAARLGFWEPWETGPAGLGRALLAGEGGHVFAPMLQGELVARGWLEPLLLRVGASLGGELGFRLPFVLLQLLVAGLLFHVVAARFGALRAAVATLAWGTTPLVVLSSFSLAGDTAYLVPLTGFVLVLAHVTTSDEARAPLWTVLLGVLLALCLWGRGVVGVSIPLYIAALYAWSAREPDGASAGPWRVAGFVMLAIALLAPAVAWAVGGRETGLLWVQLGLWIDVPLVALLFAVPGSRLRRAVRSPVAWGGLAAFVVLSAWPLAVLLGAVDGDQAVRFLLEHGSLNGDGRGAAASFDELLRIVGFSAFPLVMLLPFAMGWVFATSSDEDRAPTDDPGAGAAAFRVLLVIMIAVGFGAIGVAWNAYGHTLFPLALPLSVPVALALTDRRYMSAAGGRRVAFHAAALAGLFLLVVLSRDVRGQFDEAMGRPGPRVIFEFLLQDGALAFPPEYAFAGMRLLVVAWALLLLLTFAEPLRTLRLAPAAALTAAPFAWTTRLAERWQRGPAAALERLAERWPPATRVGLVAGLWTATLLLWAGGLTLRYVPDIDAHVSNRGLVERLAASRDEGQPVYALGLPDQTSRWYVGPVVDDYVTSVGDIRRLFCDDSRRAFAIVPAERLGEAYHEVRREPTRREADGCEAARELHVIYAASSRYVLVSNRIEPQLGERDDSVIARHVLRSESELPDHALRADQRIVVDGRLRLVASAIEPPVLRGGGSVSVTTWWEVLQRMPANHEIFVHIDTRGNRINGDHKPVEGRFDPRWWVPGEIVRDTHTMRVSSLGDRRGEYRVLLGWFRGDDRLTVDPPMQDNRIDVGPLWLRGRFARGR